MSSFDESLRRSLKQAWMAQKDNSTRPRKRTAMDRQDEVDEDFRVNAAGSQGWVGRQGFNADGRSGTHGTPLGFMVPASSSGRMMTAEREEPYKRRYMEATSLPRVSPPNPRTSRSVQSSSCGSLREHQSRLGRDRSPGMVTSHSTIKSSGTVKPHSNTNNRAVRSGKPNCHITPNPEARRQEYRKGDVNTDKKLRKEASKTCCPVPECQIRTQTLARHVRMLHLPPPFRPVVSEQLNHQRMAALNLVAQWLGSSSVELLVNFVVGRVPFQSSPISQGYINVFNSLCEHNGWKLPAAFDLRNPSSPCMLVHWRLILTLLCMLSEEQRKTFHSLFPEMTESDSPSDTAEPVAERVEWDPAVIPPMEIIDTHYHVDRTARAMNLDDRRALLEDILDVHQEPKPCQPVIIEGGIAAYCDPEQYPNVYPRGDEGQGMFISAFGCHPRKVMQFSGARSQEKWDLLDSNPEAAMGEIGLDLTEPEDTWAEQEAVFKEVLERCCLRRTLVLHVRDHPGKMGPYYKAMEIVRGACGYRQRIHLHGFNGDEAVVSAWLTYFPNMCFGFTGAVAKFNSKQLEAVKAVPSRSIILESDSPYKSPHPDVAVNTPAYLGDVAQMIADIRGVQLQDLLMDCNQNARELYRLGSY